MKRFFRFGKGKKDASSDTVSNVSSRRSSTSSANVAASPATGGYEIRDKDLGKIHKAIIKKDLDKVRRLASKETNVVDKESRTALHLAAATGFGAAMQELMQWKANLNVKDKDGKTPLHKAIENQHENCARMLLDARADPTCKDKDGNSSVHCAAKAGMFEIFKELRKSQKVISSGPDHPNSMGETPLHLATIARNLSICKFIVNSGVNIDAKDSKGFTALMLACQMGNDDLVSLLVEHNADTGIKDTNGWTAEDIAMNNGHAACRQAILQHQSHLPMRPDSHIYSTAESIHDEEDEEEADSQGKPASNVLKAVSDDKNASGDHQGTGDQQSTTDPKSWSDDDPLSEIEVTNKKRKSLGEEGTLLGKSANVMNSLVADDANEQSDEENEGGHFPLKILKDENKGFIYNNMTKNLNILPEKDDASATRQMNQRQNIVGLPPPSPSKAQQRSGIGDQAPLSARTISPRSWSNGDSHMDGLQASSNAGTREKPLPQKPQKGTEDSSDDDWTAEPSQSSQLSQPNKSQQEKLSQTKPDNRRTAADLGANDIYAAVNKGKTGDRKRMTDELGLDDAEVDDSEATSQMVTSLQSQDKIPKNIPTSARSAVSDWDSTVAEETPREFKPKAETSGKTLKETKSKNSDKDKHESDSPWDSEDGGSDDIPEIPELKTVELNKKYHLNGITAKQTETTKDVDSPERASSCSFSITDVSDVLEVKGSVVSDDDDEEEESTWEKERKTSKINKLEKQKSKSDVKIGQTYGAQLSYAGESKEVVFQQQPLKVDRVETWEISTTKSPASNEENELLLNNRPVLSSQVKESFREPLASVSNKMSFEESASDDQLSPRNLTARSISLNTDMNNVIRLQELIRDGQRKLETERSAKTLLENKRKSLENERAKLVDQLQVVTREKFTLDQVKIDLESKVRDLEYHLNEENEQRKNTDILFEKTKEQLARKEKEILELTKAKQMTDTSLKNELKEKTSALTVAKQLEEEIKSLKKQLNEKNIFVVQDESSSSNQQSIIQSGALLRDKHFQLVPSFGSSPEIYATQMKINHEKERTKDDFEQLMRENEKLHKHNEELIEKMSRQEEALTHASLHYNIDLMQLKSDNNQLTVRSEKDTNAKEELSREVNSLKRQLSSVNTELQTALDAKAETERQRQQLAEALSRSKEKQQQELDSTKNLFQSQSEQLSQVLPKMQKLESELMIVNTILAERTSQLGSLQKDHDKYRSSHGLMDESNAKLKEENIRLEAKVELLQERLNESQRELQSVKHSAEVKDINVERPEDLTILLSSLKAEHDRTKSHLDERNASLAESLSKAKEELKLTERGRINTEDEKRRLQTSLNEAQKQLLAAEATIEVNNQLKQQLEMERLQLKSEIDQLKDKLEDGRKKVLHQEQKVIELTHLLKTAENSAATSYEHLNKKNSSVHGLLKAKNELEENLHKLEVENAKLDAALTHEREKADMLQRDYSESKQSNNQLENECEKLKSSNTELQFLINEAAGLKTLATQEADDNRALWESEIRSRSKLGLRLAQLEREKRELDSKVQEEKRRVRRALELKKSTEAKLEEEQERSNHLQKEISTLKVHLKAAKKRIKEHHSHVQRISNSDHYLSNGTDSHILDNESDLIHENRYHSMEAMEIHMALDDFGHELDYAKRQLHYDTEPKDYRRNRSATLASDPIQNMEHIHLNGSSAFHHDQMPLKFQMSASNYLGVSDVDRISEMLKTEAQMELNHKLQEVNRYLEDQAKAREHLDRIRNVNEAEMKKEFEKVRKEMLEEIAKVKYSFEEYATGQTDAVDNEAQQQIKDLHDRDGKLRNRLMARLDTAYSKVASSNLDYLHPVAFDQEFGALVDDELTKISNGHVSNDLILNNLRQQLDRSITRHMAAPANDRSEVTINSLHMDSLGSGRNSSNADTTSALNRNIQL